MKQITIVTGNPGKVKEWKRILPKDIKLKVVDLDLEEIQSFKPEEIVLNKAKLAYQRVKKPVVVEDLAAGLIKLNGLPGPFIKFFQQQLGKGALFELAGHQSEPAIVTCVIAYYDGDNSTVVRADVPGTIVAPRGEHGFGFDFCFVVDGQNQTFAEMSPTKKDKISHRALAINKLLEKLRQDSRL